jgi:hypothetical protein
MILIFSNIFCKLKYLTDINIILEKLYQDHMTSLNTHFTNLKVVESLVINNIFNAFKKFLRFFTVFIY